MLFSSCFSRFEHVAVPLEVEEKNSAIPIAMSGCTSSGSWVWLYFRLASLVDWTIGLYLQESEWSPTASEPIKSAAV